MLLLLRQTTTTPTLNMRLLKNTDSYEALTLIRSAACIIIITAISVRCHGCARACLQWRPAVSKIYLAPATGIWRPGRNFDLAPPYVLVFMCVRCTVVAHIYGRGTFLEFLSCPRKLNRFGGHDFSSPWDDLVVCQESVPQHPARLWTNV